MRVLLGKAFLRVTNDSRNVQLSLLITFQKTYQGQASGTKFATKVIGVEFSFINCRLNKGEGRIKLTENDDANNNHEERVYILLKIFHLLNILLKNRGENL